MNVDRTVTTVNNCVPISLDLTCVIAAQAIDWLLMVSLAMVNEMIRFFVHDTQNHIPQISMSALREYMHVHKLVSTQ